MNSPNTSSGTKALVEHLIKEHQDMKNFLIELQGQVSQITVSSNSKSSQGRCRRAAKTVYESVSSKTSMQAKLKNNQVKSQEDDESSLPSFGKYTKATFTNVSDRKDSKEVHFKDNVSYGRDTSQSKQSGSKESLVSMPRITHNTEDIVDSEMSC